MTDDMRVWLRQQIEARKALAVEAHGASWAVAEYTEEHLDGGADFHMAVFDADERTELFSVTLPNSGADEDDLAHIAFNDPRQIIADCQADLMILDEHEITKVSAYEQAYAGENGHPYGCRLCHEHDGITVGWGICRTLRALASRFSHQPGYLPEWAPEGAT